MLRNEVKAKSGRKPLKDLSNKNCGRSSKSANLNKMAVSRKHNKEDAPKVVEDDNVLDQLLLVQSDLSFLVQQIDELVVQAFKLKTVSKEGRKEIESFLHVVSDMISSIKPWVPRFQRALSMPSVESQIQPQQPLISKPGCQEDINESNVGDSPEDSKLDFLISPSPLVSWRANCTIERGRHMFMLTPLPISKALSSKFRDPSKSEFNKLSTSTTALETSTFFAISRDITYDLPDGILVKPTPIKPSDSIAIEGPSTQENRLKSSSLFAKGDSSMLVTTPCLKMSPPKSCVLLEPISEISHRRNHKVRKSTPFPVGIHYSDSETSESSGNDTSQGLAMKYPELLGIHQISEQGIGKKAVEASPDWWFLSPPKTCVLLEPLDEVSLEKADNGSCIQKMDAAHHQQASILKDDALKDHNQIKKSCNQEPFGGIKFYVESTPMWNKPESSFRTGKRPGESTLKKELWTKFEAASSFGLRHDFPTVHKSAQKGFLDLLDEASEEEG